MKKGIDYIGVSAGAMIFNAKGELFLSKRSQNCKNERGHWETPGGGVEFGETLEQAVRREMREEYDAEIEIIEQFPAADHLIPAEGQHWVATTFLARFKSDQQPKIMEPDKCDEIGWFNPTALPQPLSLITQLDLKEYTRHQNHAKPKFQKEESNPMADTIATIAADPLQYDRDELIWTAEGSKDNFNRKLYLIALQPMLDSVAGKRVLDIGCGQGWLCDEIAEHGGEPLGIEPSAKNVRAAHATYPELQIEQTSLKDFKTDMQFDIATAIMVLEHFLDLEAAMRKVAMMLKPDGRFIAIVGDFDKFTNSSSHHPMEKETLGKGEVATRIDYGERAGIMCDIIRTVSRYEAIAKKAGLGLIHQTPILPEVWHPRYATHKDKPLFHLLEFVKQ